MYKLTEREERGCNLCNSDNIKDEYHVHLESLVVSDIILELIPKYYSKHPNFYMYSELLSKQQNT